VVAESKSLVKALYVKICAGKELDSVIGYPERMPKGLIFVDVIEPLLRSSIAGRVAGETFR
jgi:hypothetical protein